MPDPTPMPSRRTLPPPDPRPDPDGRPGWRRRTPRLALTLLALLASPAHAQQPSFGPLTWEEGSPLQRMAYTPVTEGAGLLPSGAWTVGLYNGLANIFEQDSAATHVLFLDLERLTTALSVRYGVSSTVEVGARLAVEHSGGGFLDQAIHDWHELWGFGQANRDRFPRGVYRELLTDGEGRAYLDRTTGGSSLKDARVSGKWGVWASADGRSVASLRAVLRVPLSHRPGVNSAVDGALMVLWRQGVGAWYVHGVLGASASPPDRALEPVLRRGSVFLTLGVERSLGSRVAALAQFQTQSAQLRSFGHREVDRAPTNLLLGLAGRVGDHWRWDASFQEDVPADTPAVDFTVTLQLRRVF